MPLASDDEVKVQNYKYVIIGGGIAGGRASDGIRKLDPDGSIAIITAEQHYPYERPPLSKGYLIGREGLDLVYLKEETHYSENSIEVIRGIRVTGADRTSHSVTLADGRQLGYDKLLLATGARAWRLPLPGHDLPGVYTLRTIEDVDQIRAAAASAQQALVLGGGFIGCEAASSLAQLGLKVTMVFRGSRLLERVVPAELSAHLRTQYLGNGVRIIAENKPNRLEGVGTVERVILESGESLEVDLVVMGVGVRLNTELAQAAGLEMAERGAIVVDEYLRTSDTDIYAAGDIAAWPDSTFDRQLRVEHWDVARRQGLRAGRNMAGEEKPYTALPYFYSDLFDLSFEAWGDLSAWDDTILRGSLDSGSFAYYYFNQGAMVGVLAVNRPEEERKPMQALVKARPSVEKVGPRLTDETIVLAELTE